MQSYSFFNLSVSGYHYYDNCAGSADAFRSKRNNFLQVGVYCNHQ
jgi:hypothetical protein